MLQQFATAPHHLHGGHVGERSLLRNHEHYARTILNSPRTIRLIRRRVAAHLLITHRCLRLDQIFPPPTVCRARSLAHVLCVYVSSKVLGRPYMRPARNFEIAPLA
jgi:hypothetical protein